MSTVNPENSTGQFGTAATDSTVVQLLQQFGTMFSHQQETTTQQFQALRETVQQTVTALAQAGNRPAVSSIIKGGRPKNFNGHKTTQEEAEQFLTAAESYFRVEGDIPDLRRINLLISMLEGEAAAWTSTWSQDLDNPVLEFREHEFLRSWPAFRQEFLLRWGDPNPRQTAFDKLKSLRQTGSAAEYALRFQALLDRADPNASHHLRYFMFRDGLKSHIRSALATRGREGPENLAFGELVNLAISIDEATFKDHQTPRSFRDPHNDAMDLSAGEVGSGADSKEARRLHRLRNGLCFYCGEKHLIKDCTSKGSESGAFPVQRP